LFAAARISKLNERRLEEEHRARYEASQRQRREEEGEGGINSSEEFGLQQDTEDEGDGLDERGNHINAHSQYPAFDDDDEDGGFSAAELAEYDADPDADEEDFGIATPHEDDEADDDDEVRAQTRVQPPP
jgi:hypothetical protein